MQHKSIEKMRKLMIMMIVVLSAISTYGQADLKGIKLGSMDKFEHKDITLVGESYRVLPLRLKNGKIYALIAVSTDEGKDRWATRQELDNLILAMNKKYGIKLERDESLDDDTAKFYYAEDRYYHYYIMYTEVASKYVIGVKIVNIKLENIAYEETLNDI